MVDFIQKQGLGQMNTLQVFSEWLVFTLQMWSSDEQRWLIASTLSLYSAIHAPFKIPLCQVYEHILYVSF